MMQRPTDAAVNTLNSAGYPDYDISVIRSAGGEPKQT
jgi:hypothetical protein